MTKRANIIAWAGQIIVAVILAQSLFFKFIGAPEAINMFTALGVEPWGRLALGVFELVTVLLLLTPRWAATGALLAIGLMIGAIGSHLLVLGISVQGDGGTLFAMAWVVLIVAAVVAWIRRRSIPVLGSLFQTNGESIEPVSAG
jgi:putative oxidoreductase